MLDLGAGEDCNGAGMYGDRYSADDAGKDKKNGSVEVEIGEQV